MPEGMIDGIKPFIFPSPERKGPELQEVHLILFEQQRREGHHLGDPHVLDRGE